MITNAGQCSCNGDNPNCFRCYGTGMIQPPDTQQRSKAYHVRQVLSSLPKKPKSYNDLPNRAVPGLLVVQKITKKATKNTKPPTIKAKKAVKPAASPFKKVNNHKTPEIYIKPVIAKPAKPVTATIECPICCNYILKTFNSFSDHLITHDFADKTKHKKLVDKSFQLIAIPLPVVQITPLTPPIMNIYSNKPSSHRSSTKVKTPKQKVSKLSNVKIIPSTDEHPGSHIICREADTRKLDSTFGQHTIREGGRFGSHPSHDSFDDESGA